MNIAYLNGTKCNDLNVISLYNPSFLYGISVFEGIRAYWSDANQKMHFFDLDKHLDRLFMSTRFISFHSPISQSELKKELMGIINSEKINENIYVRITFFIGEDTSWSDESNIHYLISIRSMASQLLNASETSLAVSTFSRISSRAMPPSIKAGANYLNSRYALIETKRKGFEGALFLTNENYISESTGSCIFFIKDGGLYTPSVDCDILEGITRNRVITLCKENNIPVWEKRLSFSSIYSFEAAFLAGTMIELKPISKIENMHYDTANNNVFQSIINLLQNYIYGLEL